MDLEKAVEQVAVELGGIATAINGLADEIAHLELGGNSEA